MLFSLGGFKGEGGYSLIIDFAGTRLVPKLIGAHQTRMEENGDKL